MDKRAGQEKREGGHRMSDRDCKNCKHNKPDGCSRWDCEYEPVAKIDNTPTVTHDKRTETHGVCSDLISRQEVIIALRESGLCYNNWLEVLGVIDAVPNAKEHITNGDLIRRQDVLNTIIVAGECEPDLGYTHLHKVVENIPSADAVEVVRCNECIFYMAMGENRAWGKCRIHDRTAQDTDYCSWAERREP